MIFLFLLDIYDFIMIILHIYTLIMIFLLQHIYNCICVSSRLYTFVMIFMVIFINVLRIFWKNYFIFNISKKKLYVN